MSGVARVKSERVFLGSIPVVGGGSIELHSNSYGEIEGLPPAKPGVIYLVSMFVVQRLEPDRYNDVFSPDSVPMSVVRDDKGRILGVQGLTSSDRLDRLTITDASGAVHMHADAILIGQ